MSARTNLLYQNLCALLNDNPINYMPLLPPLHCNAHPPLKQITIFTTQLPKDCIGDHITRRRKHNTAKVTQLPPCGTPCAAHAPTDHLYPLMHSHTDAGIQGLGLGLKTLGGNAKRKHCAVCHPILCFHPQVTIPIRACGLLMTLDFIWPGSHLSAGVCHIAAFSSSSSLP